MTEAVLGIDPGTRKSGFALLALDGSVLAQGIEATGDLVERVRSLAIGRPVVIALGGGTNALPVHRALDILGIPIHLVDERETSLRARTLYFTDHPPRGWRRLIPLSFQLPPRPIDDYAAILIGRRYLVGGGSGQGMA